MAKAFVANFQIFTRMHAMTFVAQALVDKAIDRLIFTIRTIAPGVTHLLLAHTSPVFLFRHRFKMSWFMFPRQQEPSRTTIISKIINFFSFLIAIICILAHAHLQDFFLAR